MTTHVVQILGFISVFSSWKLQARGGVRSRWVSCVNEYLYPIYFPPDWPRWLYSPHRLYDPFAIGLPDRRVSTVKFKIDSNRNRILSNNGQNIECRIECEYQIFYSQYRLDKAKAWGGEQRMCRACTVRALWLAMLGRGELRVVSDALHTRRRCNFRVHENDPDKFRFLWEWSLSRACLNEKCAMRVGPWIFSALELRGAPWHPNKKRSSKRLFSDKLRLSCNLLGSDYARQGTRDHIKATEVFSESSEGTRSSFCQPVLSRNRHPCTVSTERLWLSHFT